MEPEKCPAILKSAIMHFYHTGGFCSSGCGPDHFHLGVPVTGRKLDQAEIRLDIRLTLAV